MTIALYATEPLSLDSIASALQGEGADVRAIDVDEIKQIRSFGAEIEKAVLIVPKHGAGDPTAWFRSLLNNNQPLILCTVQPENAGYEKLRSVGATTIITPRSWSPEHVAERILGQLIQDGHIALSACGELYGATQLMRNVYKEISIVAPLDDPVLIIGETGTGKELCAREIHKQSQRLDKFVEVNCATLTADLVNSELFGHEKGSFTGAGQARDGLFVAAGEGTVFLDEIGELDLKVQATLLKVLEEKKVRPVGSNQARSAPARVLLATNRDLERECEEGRFRPDLFERIRGFTIELAPLQYRRADLPLLAEVFRNEFNSQPNQNAKFGPGSLDSLFKYHWPGNVRELRNAIRKAAAYADTNGFVSGLQLIQSMERRKRRAGSSARDAKYLVAFDPAVHTWKKFSERAQVAYFQALLDATGGNRKEAHRLSGLGSSQFYENLKTLAANSDEAEPA